MTTRARSWLTGLLGVAAVLVAVGVAWGAYLLAGYSWGQVVSYESPYVGMLESGPADSRSADPAVGRIVLVIVDGMRDDVSRESMPTLGRLRESGADLVLETPQPSLSYPNWTTILTGATQEIHGVTTNWYDQRVPLPGLLDSIVDGGLTYVVAGPQDYEPLYDLSRAEGVSLREWPKTGYQTPELIDDALRLTATHDPDLVLVHLPDLDEAGHAFGGKAPEYATVAAAIDSDIARLVSGLEDGDTTFVITSDHGHIDAGGHGGWETVVTRAPAVLAGPGVLLYSGEHRLEDLAPTISSLAGVPAPLYARGTVIAEAVAVDDALLAAEAARRRAFAVSYAGIVWPEASAQGEGSAGDDAAEQTIEAARERRLTADRAERLPTAVTLALVALLPLLLIASVSRHALTSVSAGVVAYLAVYNGLYFLVHGHRWSLSAFNTEDTLQAFFNLRMIEAAIAGVVACAVAAYLYPALRQRPKGPRRGYAAGWLALGPAVVLAIQSVLAIQVAWFLWAWGADVAWTMPDLRWGFKYDLDLIQATALGGVAVLAPLVTYLIGRYHPLLRSGHGNQGPA